MHTRHVKYLLVGGGLAGSSAAEAIRQHDRKGSALLIGQEVNRPYHRPPLSKRYLRREQPRAELMTLPASWFPQNHVELQTGRRAAQLDTARRTVVLDNGEEISFEKLLLATGAWPTPLRIPGSDLPNLFYLRTLDDVDRLEHAIETARNEGTRHPRGRGRVAVIGAGLLGVELAASLTQMGLAVDLVVKHPLPWNRFAGESTGRFLARYLESNDVTLHSQRVPQRLEGDGRVQRVVFSSDEALPCDFAIAAIGASAARDILRNTPIAAENAILTDEYCRTNVAEIYAAGDCAAIFDPLFGKHRIVDHWDHARSTGWLAGANMAGAEQPFKSVSCFFSSVLAIELAAWGEPRLVDRRLLRGSTNPQAPDFAEIGIDAQGRVTQTLAIGRQREHAALRMLVAKRFRVDGLEEYLRDPQRELERIVRA